MAASTTRSPVPIERQPRADAQRNSARVLEAARAVFAERGPDASLEEIARRAGVGIGTLYRHYPTRRALLAAVFAADAESARAHAEELLRADDAVAAFTTWLREQFEQVGACRALGASVMIASLDDVADLPSPCVTLREGGAALLARAQAAGGVRLDTTIDDLLRMVSAIAMATEDSADDRQSERLFDLVLDAIRA
jgi:AcrR family transcriptional regulator